MYIHFFLPFRSIHYLFLSRISETWSSGCSHLMRQSLIGFNSQTFLSFKRSWLWSLIQISVWAVHTLVHSNSYCEILQGNKTHNVAVEENTRSINMVQSYSLQLQSISEAKNRFHRWERSYLCLSIRRINRNSNSDNRQSRRNEYTTIYVVDG